jgi:hypothetical protein
MDEPTVVVVPKELYYHEVAYVRALEAENRALKEVLKTLANATNKIDFKSDQEAREFIHSLAPKLSDFEDKQ